MQKQAPLPPLRQGPGDLPLPRASANSKPGNFRRWSTPGGRPDLMRFSMASGGTRRENPPQRTTTDGISFLQMNFRGSETTWILCQQELADRDLRPDVILVQDPPSSVCVGKNVFRGYRAIRPASHGPCHALIRIRDCLSFLAARPFGRRVVGIELLGREGPVLAPFCLHSTHYWGRPRSP